MGKVFNWWYKPLPMGILASAICALIVMPLALWLGDWQARQGELRELELVRKHTSERIEAYFDSLLNTLNQAQGLQLKDCSDSSLEPLFLLTAQALFVEGIGRASADGQLCDSFDIPSAEELAKSRHWNLNGVDIWWKPKLMGTESSYPSLVISRDHVFLASSLRYLHAIAQLPAGVSGILLGPEHQVMDLSGAREHMSGLEADLVKKPDELVRQDGRTYLLGKGKQNGLRLLISRPELEFLSQRHLYQGIGVLFSLVLVGLVGRLVAAQMNHDQSLERALRLALRYDEFEVDYQPLVDLASGRCVGAEALVRWRRSDGQRVRPDLFIPQAEESGLIIGITHSVIKRVISDQAELLRANPELYISLNLAAADIVDGAFKNVAAQALKGANVPATQLVYEVTERGLIDVERAVELLGELRRAGHRIAIDDFGTGYSSLSYLQHLPVDILKIDKCFVDALGTEAVSSPVAAHIVQMAQSLGLKVVAEGVERSEQAQLLIGLGAQIGQGWLFAKPLDAKSFRDYVSVL